MNLKEGDELHVEMIGRKEVLIRKEVSPTLSAGLDKMRSLKGVLKPYTT